MKDLLLCVHVVVETLNLEISRCHFADYVKELYKSACRTIIVWHGIFANFREFRLFSRIKFIFPNSPAIRENYLPPKKIRKNLLHFFLLLNFNSTDCKQYHSLPFSNLNPMYSVSGLCVNL